MEECTRCKAEVHTLFAAFDEGAELYCSDCQIEAENAENEDNENYWG